MMYDSEYSVNRPRGRAAVSCPTRLGPTRNASVGTGSSPCPTPSQADAFYRDVIDGLSRPSKRLHCKYFYDERGSLLFDAICELPEYYLTRTEAQIMARHSAAIADRIGDQAVLVEYGSGSSTKTRLLLDHLSRPLAYLPVDISADHLQKTADQLRADYPRLDVHPVVADFTRPFSIPIEYREHPRTIYFPGSTIGNLEPCGAIELLKKIADQCGKEGRLLIGFDLEKDVDVLLAAYDDAQGVTAEFNLNLLRRINAELGADFRIDQFRHVAIFNHEKSRIEIFIESQVEQRVTLGDSVFHFEAGERIFTEYSHKYSLDRFAAMASQAGLSVDEVWQDDQNYFAVMLLSTSVDAATFSRP